MNVGTQLVALSVVLVVAAQYFQYRRLKLVSTKMFECFLALSVFCMLSDVFCAYSLYHPQYFSMEMVRVFHQFFLGSLNFLIYYVYIYIDVRGRRGMSYTPSQFICRSLPLIIATFFILFAPLEYHVGDDGCYSYGAMVDAVFALCFIYMLLVIITILRVRKSINEVARIDFWFSFAIWIMIASYQFFVPNANLISLALALIVLFIFIAFENSKENADKDVPCILSRHSFENSLEELFGEQKNFWVINFVMLNADSLRSTYSQRACFNCLNDAIKTLPDYNTLNVFRSSEYSFSFLFFSWDDVKEWYARYRVTDNALLNEDPKMHPSFQVCCFECPKIAKDPQELFNLMNFCHHEFDAQNDRSIRFIDSSVADKRAYQVQVERIVQKAIDDDGFNIVYQPILNTKTGKFESAEALIRLKDISTLGFISPEVFIPLAEKKGLISTLGDIVLNKVCQFVRDNRLNEKGMHYVEVNLSALQISDPSLPFRLHQMVKNYDLDPSFINLEITETASVDEEKLVSENMDKLKKLGYKFSMDDFGTGYSNLSKIAALDYDLVKFDKSLIWPAFEKGNDTAMRVLTECLKLMHSLGNSIVAEGVETKEQADFLTGWGVEYLQGYYYSRPLNEDDFLEYMRTHN